MSQTPAASVGGSHAVQDQPDIHELPVLKRPQQVTVLNGLLLDASQQSARMASTEALWPLRAWILAGSWLMFQLIQEISIFMLPRQCLCSSYLILYSFPSRPMTAGSLLVLSLHLAMVSSDPGNSCWPWGGPWRCWRSVATAFGSPPHTAAWGRLSGRPARPG